MATGVGQNLLYLIADLTNVRLQPDILGIRLNPLSKRIQTEAYRAWMAGLLFNTISGVYTLYHLKQRAVTLTGKNGKTAVEKKELER